ncbi:putative polyadenylation protein [Vairimorpha necatrix]|uniref:Polyadenylation protein n=1 Tax=Vairimorpha necatrix TaxID=6039 RepID=A0AAX4JEH6_9MICR
MIIEIVKNNEGFLYAEEKNQIFKYEHDYQISSYELVNNIFVYTIKNFKNKIFHSENSKLEKFDFKCKHFNKIEYSSYNLLPSEDWHELIDCWSCHNNEFASVKDLKIKVRPKGLLISSFFLFINKSDLPECCQDHNNSESFIQDFKSNKTIKLWFNELENVDHKKVIFDYLFTYFKYNNIFIFKYKDKIYEMKFFYTLDFFIINKNQYTKSMKIGIRENPNLYFKPKNNEFINDFYIEMIYNEILYLDIEILNYKTGFIFC